MDPIIKLQKGDNSPYNAVPSYAAASHGVETSKEMSSVQVASSWGFAVEVTAPYMRPPTPGLRGFFFSKFDNYVEEFVEKLPISPELRSLRSSPEPSAALAATPLGKTSLARSRSTLPT